MITTEDIEKSVEEIVNSANTLDEISSRTLEFTKRDDVRGWLNEEMWGIRYGEFHKIVLAKINNRIKSRGIWVDSTSD